MPARLMLVQFLAVLVMALIAGSVFGIWRGYNPAGFQPATFVEMHQGAVRGLNVLLPALGFIAIALTVLLVGMARGKGHILGLYLSALVLMVAAGLTTRLFNQPINALVMGWSAEALPADWARIRDDWWTWHLWRTGFSISALTLLLGAIMLDRPAAR